MRRLLLQVQTTIDGYMAGPNHELDWLTCPWTEDIDAYITALMASVDTIVLGRNLAEGFIPAWASRPEGEPEESIDWMNNTPKVVISNSLTESPWENAVVAGGDLTKTITQLKAQPGGDLIVYGGVTLVQNLLARELIDDIHLFVNPTAVGGGKPVFASGDGYQRLQLAGAQPFACGITALHLQPKRD